MSVLGPKLQEEREAQGLTVEDISNRLRLSPRQVKAIESEDFTALPEPTITRGFIRNYARLLELDPEPLLEAYRAHMPSEPPRAISIPSANIPISDTGRRPWMVFIIGGLLIALVLGVWIYADDISTNLKQETAPVPSTEEPEPQPLPGAAESMPVPALPLAERMAEQGLPAQGSDISGDPGAGATENAAGQAVSSENLGQTTATAGNAKLEFSFSDKSWVSVIDANGQEILNKTKPAGSREVVEGKPPFKVVIGNADVSSLTYNGKAIDLAPHTRLNVARITLE